MREAGDGRMDAQITFDDGSTGLERVNNATLDDVKSEIAKEEQRHKELLEQGKQAKQTDPWLPVVQQAELSEKLAKDSAGPYRAAEARRRACIAGRACDRRHQDGQAARQGRAELPWAGLLVRPCGRKAWTLASRSTVWPAARPISTS